NLEAGIAGFGHGRQIDPWSSLARRERERLEFAALHVRLGGGVLDRDEIEIARHQVGERRPGAFVRDVHRLDPGERFKELGGDLATNSEPIAPEAPARFSTTTGCPVLSESLAPTPRAIRSSAPPGAKGAISRIGLLGKGCASAPWTTSAANKNQSRDMLSPS